MKKKEKRKKLVNRFVEADVILKKIASFFGGTGAMKIIAGLGNPGEKYKGTRHNVGFMVVEQLAKDKGEKFERSKNNSLYTEIRVGEEKIFLIKPLNYMNRSGEAIALWKEYYKISNKDILIIYDDMDLKLGDLKIKPKGSAAGHRGMDSIINLLGTQEIPRMKVGIGKPGLEVESSSYVLQKFDTKELEVINTTIEKAAQGAEEFCIRPLNEVMTRYNSN